MSYQNSVNVLTKSFAQTSAAGFVKLYDAGALKNTLGIFCATQLMQVAIGVSAGSATDALSILVPAGTSFSIETGLVGEVSVKVGADATINAYGA